MVKTSSSLLSFSLLALLVFSVLANVYILRSVDAQSPYELSKITGFTEDIVAIDYVSGTGILWVLTSEVDGSFRIGHLYSVNATSEVIITSTQVWNSTASNSALYDMDCSSQYCYVAKGDAVVDTGETGIMFRVDISAGDGTAIAPGAADLNNDGNIYNFATVGLSSAGVFGGQTVMYGRHFATSGTSAVVETMDALYLDWSVLTPSSLTVSGLANSGHSLYEIRHSQNSAPNNFIVGAVDSAAAGAVYHYDLDAGTLVCIDTTSVIDGGAVVPDPIDLGLFYSGQASGVINVRSLTDCLSDYTLSGTVTGLANTVFDMSIVEIGETKYLIARDSGTGGAISFMPWNGTAFDDYDFIVYSVPTASQGLSGTGTLSNLKPNVGKLTHGFEVGKMFVPMTGSDRAVFVVDIGSAFEEGEEGDDGYGNPAGGGGTSSGLTVDLVNAPDDFLTGLLNVDTEQANMIATGIVHGLFLIVPMIYMISGAKKGGQTPQIPLFVWAILALMAGGISVSLGWMPILFLFAEIVLIVAAFAFLVSRGVGIT